MSLVDTQDPGEMASPGFLASTWRGNAYKRVLRSQDKEAVVRDLFEEILSEWMEFKTYATEQFWLLAKHVRQTEIFIFAVSNCSFSCSPHLFFLSQGHKRCDQDR